MRNILDALEFEIDTSTPICIIKELKKKDIDKKFEINLEKFKNFPKERQISELFTSYLVHYYKEEIDPFVKKYKLKRKPSAVSFYVFEGEERADFLRLPIAHV